MVDERDLVSVVVPVYNVEGYLGFCLDSLRSQTYKNLEIILVDDGSTDDSAKICQKFASEDQRFVYLRKENGGLSSARNYGIQYATGKWLLYIDSDDLIDPNYIGILVSKAREYEVETVVCDFSFIGAGTSAYSARYDAERRRARVLKGEEAFSVLLSERYSCCAAWGKLSRTRNWRKVLFPEGRKFEDFPRLNALFNDGESVALLSWPGYAYRKGGESITSKKSASSASDLMESIRELESQKADFRAGCSRSAAFKLCLESTRLVRMASDFKEGEDFQYPQVNEARLYARDIIEAYWGLALLARDAALVQRLRILLFRLLPGVSVRVLNGLGSLRTRNL